jgi:hypothetical protein
MKKDPMFKKGPTEILKGQPQCMIAVHEKVFDIRLVKMHFYTRLSMKIHVIKL